MKILDLGNGKTTKVDDDVYEQVKDFNWRYQKSANGSSGYAVTTVKLHRIVAQAKKGEMVDHINRDKLDNRNKNVRVTTSSVNHQNRKPVNGYKGVHWNKIVGKWVARIGKNGKRKFLGYFINKTDAAKAYDKEAKKLYGRLAYTNLK